MNEIPQAVLDELKQSSAFLAEHREKLLAAPTASDLKEVEDRIVNDVVKAYQKKQEVELTQIRDANEALQKKADLLEQQMAEARKGGNADPADSPREKAAKAAFRSYLASGQYAQSRDVQQLIEAEQRGEFGDHEKRALSVSVGSEGGVLVPEGEYIEMQKVFTRVDPVEALAQRFEVAGDRDTWFVPQLTTAVETQGAAAVTSESSLPTAAAPAFALKQRTLHYTSVYTTGVTPDWFRMIRNGESILSGWAAESLAYKANYDYLWGAGAGQSQGLLTGVSGTDLNTDVTANDTSAHLVTAPDFIDLLAALKAPYRANAVFLFNTTVMAKIMKLRDNSGGAGTGQFLLPISARDGFPTTIFGRPFYTSENIQNDGTDDYYAVLCGDFSKYGVADVGTVEVFRDTMSTMPNTRILWRRKHDGAIINKEAFVRLKM